MSNSHESVVVSSALCFFSYVNRMRFIAFGIFLIVLSHASLAHDCTNLGEDSGQTVNVCLSSTKNSPTSKSKNPATINSEVLQKPVEVVLSPSTIRQIRSIVKSQSKTETTHNPTQYELTKEDVQINQRGMKRAAWAAFGGICATIALLFWNGLQLQKANRLGLSMAKSSVRAAVAAKKTADAAEITERAYVMVDFECIKKTTDSGDDFVEVTAWIVNVGKTPAIDITYEHGWSGYKTGNAIYDETPIGMLSAGQKVQIVDFPKGFSLNPFIGPFGDKNTVASINVRITGYRDIFGVEGKRLDFSGSIDKAGKLRTNTRLTDHAHKAD